MDFYNRRHQDSLDGAEKPQQTKHAFLRAFNRKNPAELHLLKNNLISHRTLESDQAPHLLRQAAGAGMYEFSITEEDLPDEVRDSLAGEHSSITKAQR